MLTVKAKKRSWARSPSSGRLVAGGRGVSGISVAILAGKKSVGKAVDEGRRLLQHARHRIRDGEVLRLGRRSAAEDRHVLRLLRPCPVRRVVGGGFHGEEHGGEGELGRGTGADGREATEPPSRINPPRPFHTKT